MRNNVFSPKKKERKKVFRSILEAIILIFLFIIILRALLPSKPYSPFLDNQRVQTENGFIAISYFGIDRIGNNTLISTSRMDQHLKALKDSGYVTITQQDILDYYQNKKALPEKSLFLIFEDGRRDTGIFAQKIMEQYNYKASMLTYAQNLSIKDAKFLNAKDLLELEESSFWELGTNGYRLSFINVFDRHGKFLDQLDTYEFNRLSAYVDRNYDHYLMDYIRDENGIPMENLAQMQERISADYTSIKDIYTEEIEKVPDMYILMHSNTGQFGTNDKVSNVNQTQITNLFEMNFNREGDSLNTEKTSIYDLTRMQPQSYWYTNHLLMRIWDDTKQDVAFISGDTQRKSNWDMLFGESEFIDDTIVLTSLPSDHGLMKLKSSEDYKNISLSVELKGNKAGTQTVYFRADNDLNKYLSVELTDNIIYVYEKDIDLEKQLLYSLNLDDFDGIIPQSWDENKLEAEIKELQTAIKYTSDEEEAKDLALQLKEKLNEQAASVTDGSKEYVPPIALSEAGNRKLTVKLFDGKMSIWIDEKAAVEDLHVKDIDAGSIYIESAYSGYNYSQRNLTDDVYDGIFKNIVVYPYSGNYDDSEVTTLYDNRLIGIDKAKSDVKQIWDSVLNWFITYL